MRQINLMAPIGYGSLGVIGNNILHSLRDIGVNVSLFPIGEKIHFNNANDLDICSGAIRYARHFPYKAPTLKLWYSHELATKPGSGKYYGFIFLETDDLTATDIYHIKYCDGIFVGAQWMKDILSKYKAHDKIYVIPNAVDTRVFDSTIAREDNENYIFFSYGAWDLRNGYDFLIKAFNTAFSTQDKVELRILPHNEFLKAEELNFWLKLIDTSPVKEKISVYNRLDTQHDLANFIAQGDCGLFTHRLAIYANNILETMAMNKPLIVSDYRSYKEYCNSDNSYLITIQEEEQARDGRLLFGTGNWAKLGKNEFDHTVEMMRHVYENKIKTNPRGLNIAKKYSLHNMANTIDLILNKVSGYHNHNKRTHKIKITTEGV